MPGRPQHLAAVALLRWVHAGCIGSDAALHFMLPSAGLVGEAAKSCLLFSTQVLTAMHPERHPLSGCPTGVHRDISFTFPSRAAQEASSGASSEGPPEPSPEAAGLQSHPIAPSQGSQTSVEALPDKSFEERVVARAEKGAKGRPEGGHARSVAAKGAAALGLLSNPSWQISAYGSDPQVRAHLLHPCCCCCCCDHHLQVVVALPRARVGTCARQERWSHVHMSWQAVDLKPVRPQPAPA